MVREYVLLLWEVLLLLKTERTMLVTGPARVVAASRLRTYSLGEKITLASWVELVNERRVVGTIGGGGWKVRLWVWMMVRISPRTSR